MKVRALRGVCIGVARHMKPGDVEELDANTSQFLISIGAVERVLDEAPKPIKVEPAPPAPNAIEPDKYAGDKKGK